jgi:hypothetical protein
MHPECLLLLLCAANVCVWAQQDMLQLRLLLINLLDGLATLQGSDCIVSLCRK